MATKARKYKKTSCHTTITAARKKAKAMKKKGLTAQVRKNKKGACVYSAGKSKVKPAKKTKHRRTRRKKK